MPPHLEPTHALSAKKVLLTRITAIILALEASAPFALTGLIPTCPLGSGRALRALLDIQLSVVLRLTTTMLTNATFARKVTIQIQDSAMAPGMRDVKSVPEESIKIR
jgi:hypothetical protein